MKLSINKQSIAVINPYIFVSDTENVYECEYEFSSDWDGYAKTATFKCQAGEYQVFLTGNTCVIPSIVVAQSGLIQFGVFGTKVVGDKQYRYPTVWSSQMQVAVGSVADGTPPERPDIYAQIIAIAQGKQDKLVSGTNIKTINNQSVLGPGNLTIEAEAQVEDVLVNGSSVVSNKIASVTVPTATSSLTNDSGFITKLVNDLTNYYLKTETYTKVEVNALIAGIKQFTYEVVATLPAASASTMFKIYLVPTSSQSTQDTKDEYITIENQGVYSWEKIGSTSADFSNYYNKQETDALLSNKYQKPASGIPKTDLEASVQTSLGKADSALQEHQSLQGYATESWVEGKGYLTQHQSLSAYRTALSQDVIDLSLSNRIEDIEDIVPSQASESNKLADKEFVNSSIATESAHYISDQGQPFTDVEDLPTEGVTNNDYAYVTGSDVVGNTYFDKYKATVPKPAQAPSIWAKEYRLNNSSFTASQWAAISSGITSAGVAEIALNTSSRHGHSNKTLLDTYSQTEANLSDAVVKKHAHANKATLDTITSALVDVWNSASTWIINNGANILVHLSNTGIHITGSERSTWNAKAEISDIPTKTSDLINDGDGSNSFITQHQSLSAYRTSANQDIIDAGLDNRLDGIEEVIPDQASSQNKLADKNFVNSSISTETAHYISNNGQPFSSLAQLEAYSGTVTNNDYAYVTGVDEVGNTYFDKYKATVPKPALATSIWAKEYRLNNSSFTAAQWAAISSGITSSYVADIASNTTARHSHSNKNLLDAYNQTNADISDAVTKKHEHINKGVLDGITSSIVSAWDGAVSWISTNGSNIINHLSNSVIHITSSERTSWSNKSTVSVSDTGSSTDEVQYITIDGVQKKLAGGDEAAWGNITGTLSNQTDLQGALNSKANQSTTYTKTEVNTALSGKENQITVSASEPTSPENGDMWYDTDADGSELPIVIPTDVAAAFSASINYAIYDLCVYNGDLYRFTAAHSAGAWIGSDAELAIIDGAFARNKNNTLTTVSKEVVGSINEINSQKQSKTDNTVYLSGGNVVEAINQNHTSILTKADADSVYTKSEIDTTVGTLQPRTDNLLSTNTKTVVGGINEVNSIALGATKAVSYGNISTMVTALNAFTSTEYRTGQNIYIVTLDVPDLWVSSVEASSVPYTYVDDATFVNALVTNGYVQVGYYKLSAMETNKVDLSNYYTKSQTYSQSEVNTALDGKTNKTDVAGTNTGIAGLVRISSAYNLINTDGYLASVVRSFAEYSSGYIEAFVDKGTLENVLDNESVRIDKTQSLSSAQKSQAESNIGISSETFTFTLSDGTTVTKTMKVGA